jgi:predicted kinase
MAHCIVVSGPPCAGKSTVAMRLAAHRRWPLLAKDAYKEVVFRHLGWRDRDWSRQVSGLAWKLLLAEARALLTHGIDCILEGNWRAPQARALAELTAIAGTEFVEVHCFAAAAVLLARYRARSLAGTRHPGHVDLEALADVEQDLLAMPCAVLADATRVLSCDTSEGIDATELLDRVDRLLVAR